MQHRALRLVNHNLRGTMCLVVQCPHCTHVYDAGRFAVEDELVMLGAPTDVVCVECGATLPRPLLFEDVASARAYLDSVNTPDGVPARLIAKRMLERAHIDIASLADALRTRCN